MARVPRSARILNPCARTIICKSVSEFPNLGPRLPDSRLPDLRVPGLRMLVLFDGRCGFCNASIRWFLRRDRHDRLRFAPAPPESPSEPQDPRLADLLARHHIAPAPSSILVVRNSGTPLEQILTRSSAAIALLAALPQPWPAVAAILRVVPRPLRDLGYRLIARNRYRIAGRLDACPIPTPGERARFL